MSQFDDETFRVFTAPMGCELLNRGTRIIERDGWYQVITPGSTVASRNMVIYSSVAESDAEAIIDDTIAQYRAIGTAIRWCVGPPTRPVDFGQRLRRRGFTETDLRGMACHPEQIVAQHGQDAKERKDIVVERAGLDLAHLYAETMVIGWHTGDAPPSQDAIAVVREDHLWTLAQPGERFQSFLARYQGKPAGTAGYILKGDLAYLVGGNVLPEFRQRGIYRALIVARMARLAELGIRYAVTQAREATSAPILEKLGFSSVYNSKIFTLT